MTGLLILTAVELEARTLARELELPALGSLPFPAFGRGPVRVAPVGLRAGLLAARLPALLGGPDRPLVVSAGLCGGLVPGIARTELVIPESVLGPAGERLNVTPTSHRLALSRAPGPAHDGLLLTAAEVVSTPEAKAALRAASGAIAVDLESAAILAAAQRAGCPSLVVRAVSDAAADTLPPELAGLVTPDGRLRGTRALLLAVTRPGVLPRAVTLRWSVHRALRNVAGTLAALRR